MATPRDTILLHGGANDGSTVLIMSALAVTAAVPLLALVLFYLSGALRRGGDDLAQQASPLPGSSSTPPLSSARAGGHRADERPLEP